MGDATRMQIAWLLVTIYLLEIDRLFCHVFPSITLLMKTPNYGIEFCDTVLCIYAKRYGSLGF